MSKTVQNIPIIDLTLDSPVEESSFFSSHDDTTIFMDLIAKTPEKKTSRYSKPTKENLEEEEEHDYDGTNLIHTGASSVHTASSLDSLPDGKLPIETNRIELTWGCVRVGKRKVQNFILRNRSQSKLRLQIISSVDCFRILNSHSELDSVSELAVFMHPSESRSFRVLFTPTTIGAAVGELRFSPASQKLEMQYRKKQVLNLYGYGGHANVEVQGVSKDTNMKMWLSLGMLDNVSELQKQFHVKNVGDLPAFAYLKFTSKGLYQPSKLLISPTEIVMKPNETVAVNLNYLPTKQDIQHLFAITRNQVMEIGSIQLVTGAEVLRGRIRRLCNKLKLETGKVENPLITQLSKQFLNEKMPADLHKFKETVGCVRELMQTFHSNEITITLEKDSEKTLEELIGGMDESLMFHSLCENTIVDSKLPTFSCVVEPCTIILTPPMKMTDTVLIISHSNNCLQFVTGIEPSGILEIFTTEGLLPSGETALVSITCDPKKLQKQKNFKLYVAVNNDISEVDIKVIMLNL